MYLGIMNSNNYRANQFQIYKMHNLLQNLSKLDILNCMKSIHLILNTFHQCMKCNLWIMAQSNYSNWHDTMYNQVGLDSICLDKLYSTNLQANLHQYCKMYNQSMFLHMSCKKVNKKGIALQIDTYLQDRMYIDLHLNRCN